MHGKTRIVTLRAALFTICACGALASAGCTASVDDGSVDVGVDVDDTEQAVIPTTGLVGEWTLDETSGTTLNDTKNDYDGSTFGSPGFVAGKINNGLNLNNGTSGLGGKYAELPSNATLDAVQEGNYTLSAWFWPNSSPPSTGNENEKWAIVIKQGFHLGLAYDSGRHFTARHYLTGNVLKQVNSSSTFAVSQWHHVAMTVNKAAGTLKLFVDGALAGSTKFTAGTAARDYGTNKFHIGRATTGTSGYVWAADGKVDQVRIYNRELSATEIGVLNSETTGGGGGGTKPVMTTNAAGNVLVTTATLNGTANANGGSGTGWFRYWDANPGTCTDTGGTRSPSTSGTAISGSTNTAYSKNLTALIGGTTYWYCAIGSNATGTTLGALQSFTTGEPIPYGPTQLFDTGATFDYGPTPFSTTIAPVDPSASIIQIMDVARANGMHIVLAMTGGGHDNYCTPTPCEPGVFDPAKWKARLNQFATNATVYSTATGQMTIKQAIAARVADGTVLGTHMIDEPEHHTWNGGITDVVLDDLAAYQKSKFPTLPAGYLSSAPDGWYPNAVFSNVDFVIYQFEYDQFASKGSADPTSFRDDAIKKANTHHVGLMLSMNILDGGTRVTGCPKPQTGGVGNFGPNCRMTATQIKTAADIFTQLPICSLMMWQSDPDNGMYQDTSWTSAFNTVAGLVANRVQGRCSYQ